MFIAWKSLHRAYIVNFRVLSRKASHCICVPCFLVQMATVFLPYTDWAQWLSVFNFNIFAGSSTICIGQFSPMVKLFLGAITPAVGVILLLLTFSIHWGLHVTYKRHGKSLPKVMKFLPSAYVRTALGFFLFWYVIALWSKFCMRGSQFVCFSFPTSRL